MNKLLLIAVASAFALAGCGKEEPKAPPAPAKEVKKEEPKKEEAKKEEAKKEEPKAEEKKAEEKKDAGAPKDPPKEGK